MKWTTQYDPKVKELELRYNPVIVRVNKFDEDAAKKFDQEINYKNLKKTIEKLI